MGKYGIYLRLMSSVSTHTGSVNSSSTLMNNKKRKVIDNNFTSMQPPHLKKRKISKNPNQNSSSIEWLLNSININSFLKNDLYQNPIFIERKNKLYYKQKLNLDLKHIQQIIKLNNLQFGKHLIAKAYNIDRKQESVPNWIKDGQSVSVKKFKNVINKGYTVQFHHPQHVCTFTHKAQTIFTKLNTCSLV